MPPIRFLLLTAIWAAATFSAPAQTNITAADDLPSRLESLEKEVQRLRQLLEQKPAARANGADTAAASASLGAGGLTIRSADSNYIMRLRGFAQVDARAFFGDRQPANDTFLVRRVRPILEGTIHEKYDYRVMLDFGSRQSLSTANNGLLQDAYVNARFHPGLQLQAGKFKEPVGLERLQSAANLLFVETGYPTQLVPNRDVGVQLHGELLARRLAYALGLFNGVSDGGSRDYETTDDERDVAARIFARPFLGGTVEALSGLGLVLAGTVGDHEGAPASLVTPGQQTMFTWRASTAAASPNVVADGRHGRFSPQGYYYWGPFGLIGEYVLSRQEVRQAGGGKTAGARAELTHSAWQVGFSWMLTGETNSFTPITPSRPLIPGRGGLGAWELAARLGEMEVDPDAFPTYADPLQSVARAFSWSVGLNWHLNRSIKLSLDYEHTDLRGGDRNPVTQRDESVLFSRLQVVF